MKNKIALENEGMTNSNARKELTTGQGYDFFKGHEYLKVSIFHKSSLWVGSLLQLQ